jgi:hypothetical protein
LSASEGDLSTLTPAPWVSLLSMLNGRTPDGLDGIRDVDNPCEAFRADASGRAAGDGDCYPDGHYLCRECVNLNREGRRRYDHECEDCGAKLGRHDECSRCDGEPFDGPGPFPVTNPDEDAPDGARVGSFVRCGDQWVREVGFRARSGATS